MKTPTEIIAERIGAHEAKAVMALLKETGWIVVRHDAIRLAQMRSVNDNWHGTGQTAAQLMEINK